MKNVPKLRFKEFSSEWQASELGDVAKISSGGTPSRGKPEYWGGDIPWVTTSLIDFNIIEKAEEYITEEGLKNSSAKLFPKNTLLMAMYGQGKTRGKIAILGFEATTNQACAAIILDESIVSGLFVFHNLFGRYNEIRDLSNAGGQENLSAGLIKSISINFPASPEQTKIADFLTAIDDRISQLSQKCDGLAQYKKGVMQKIFSQELRFKDEKGRAFPAWEEKRLGDVTSKVSKKNKDNISYPVYSISNKNGFVPQSEQFDGVDSNDRNYDISLYKIVQKNTFAYNPARINVGSIGYSGEINNVIISSLYVCFKTSESVSDKYMLQYLDSFEFRKGVLRSVEGGVREYLFYENFSSIKHTFPSLKEQEKIAGFLSAVDEKISQAQAQLAALKQYKQGLLQQMFV